MKSMPQRMVRCAASVIVGAGLAMNGVGAEAAPTVFEFTGTTIATFTQGAYSSLGFANGQTFKLTLGWAGNEIPVCNAVNCTWVHTTRTIEVNGSTFVFDDAPTSIVPTTGDQRDTYVANISGNGPEKMLRDNFRSDIPGPWMSSNLPITSAETGFVFLGFQTLAGNSLSWPAAINLADWYDKQFTFAVAGGVNSADKYAFSAGAWTSVRILDDSVPTPAAFGLLILGLVGLGATRRETR